jgi:Ca-activated chloride channel family protein
MNQLFDRRVSLLALLLSTTAPLAGCSDEEGAAGESVGSGGADSSGVGAGDTGPGAPSANASSGGSIPSGTSAGPGPASSGAYGEGGGYGSGGGSGEPPPPPPVHPEEEPEETTCDDLDPTRSLVLYLSADDSNSMASPAEAREAIRNGVDPYNAIRTYEFLNYYDVSFPAPPADELGLFADARTADEPGAFDLLLAVRAPDAPAIRRPMTITFVADTSGSMDGTPMAREKAAMRAIAGQLAEGDIVNVLSWDDDDVVVLEGRHVDGPDDDVLLAAIDGLEAGGGTDLEGGLLAGYDLAGDHWGENRLNRVVMISDGGANIGELSGQVIGNASNDGDVEGIYLVGVGVGPLGAYSDELMDVVTDMGRGAYVYLDSTEEAERMFGARFDETMEVAARDVRIEVTLPWYFQMKRFYGEEYSENPEEVDPQHLAPGDVTVVMQTIKACGPDVVNLADPVRLEVEWSTPLGRLPRSTAIETTLGELVAQDHRRLDEASAIVAFAEALKTGASADLAVALQKVQALEADGDDKFAEIEDLLAEHPGM